MHSKDRATAWRIFTLLCFTYALSQFYRAANAAIGPDISRELGLGPVELSLITGIFFIAFAFVQPFVGILLDRFGPRLTMSGLMLLAIVGAAVFARGNDLVELSIGRALLGLGNSALLIGPLVIFARWFSPERFAFFSSFLIAIGTLGSLIATAPLATAATYFGWRGAFYGMSAITAISMVLVFGIVRDAPLNHPFHAREPETLATMFKGLGEVLRNRRMHLIFPMNFTFYACTITVLGLWGGPYLADVYGLDTIARGNVLLTMALGSVAGYLIWGPLDRFVSNRKWLVIAGASGLVITLILLAVLPTLSLFGITIIFIAQGLMAGCFVHVIAHGRAVFPEYLVGRGLTILNFGTMFGSFTMQYLTGRIIAAFPVTAGGTPPEGAYQAMFATLAICLSMAIFVYARIDDSDVDEV